MACITYKMGHPRRYPARYSVRSVSCRDAATQLSVDSSLCAAIPMPPSTLACAAASGMPCIDVSYSWKTGPVLPCAASSAQPMEPRPLTTLSLNGTEVRVAVQWSACSRTCASGTRSRTITCEDQCAPETHQFPYFDYQYPCSDYQCPCSDYQYAYFDYQCPCSDYQYAYFDYQYRCSDYQYAHFDYQYRCSD